MYTPRDPFPECSTRTVDFDRLSLEDLSQMFGGRSKSALHGDCQELNISCTQGVDRAGAWTLYVFMSWYQWMKNHGAQRIHRQQYWDMCTPDHRKGPDVVCGPDTAAVPLREAYVTQIGKSYDDFDALWTQFLNRKKTKRITINV